MYCFTSGGLRVFKGLSARLSSTVLINLSMPDPKHSMTLSGFGEESVDLRSLFLCLWLCRTVQPEVQLMMCKGRRAISTFINPA